MAKKEYDGSVYVAVVGSDLEHGPCRDTQEAIVKRQGDSNTNYGRATKGYENRQQHINKFIASHHDFIFMMDHDQTFPVDILERLRSHRLPYVTGFYMRRQRVPIAPVWFADNPRHQWPYQPYTGIPDEEAGLVKLGASGWGCILIHRDVILDTRKLLKGEHEVIEDDMDVWPYSLDEMMDIIHGLNDLADAPPRRRVLLPALRSLVDRLSAEFRPLRGTTDPVGSDIRFPFFAKQAGYQLWGDPQASCGHIIHYPLTLDDWTNLPQVSESLTREMRKHVNSSRRNWRQRLDELAR